MKKIICRILGHKLKHVYGYVYYCKRCKQEKHLVFEKLKELIQINQ